MTIWVLCMIIPSIFILAFAFMGIERLTDFIKNKSLSTETKYIKHDGVFGIVYVKEVTRSDGYVVERDFLKPDQYLKEVRKQKFERILNK